MPDTDTDVQICAFTSCNQPRMVGGVVTYIYCEEHLRQFRAAKSAVVEVSLPPQEMTAAGEEKPCTHPGCANPRRVSSTGRVQSYCEEHLHEAQKRYDVKRAADRQAQRAEARNLNPQPQSQRANLTVSDGKKPCKVCRQRKPNTLEYFEPNGRGLSTTCRECQALPQGDIKPRKLTAAQQAAGFQSAPPAAKATANTFKLCIIDYDADTMTFVEGKVTRRCKTDALKLLPGGWEILLAKHHDEGYVVVERGTPPVQPGVLSSYDWRD